MVSVVPLSGGVLPFGSRLQQAGLVPAREGQLMERWQIVFAAVFIASPFVLLGVFHGGRERLSSRGKPLARMWRPTPISAPVEDDHHH